MHTVALVTLLLVNCKSISAGDWPNWRGPTRDDHVADSSGWDGKEWLSVPPSWKASVGEGSSSPLVIGDAVYTLGYESGNDVLRCLNIQDGKVRWEVRHKTPRYGRFHEGDEGLYSGTSSTPEYDEATGYLYTLSTDGDLRCFNTKEQGNLIWQRNLYVDFKVTKRPRLTKAPLRDYGYTTSPLVQGELLLVEVGSTERGSVIAFDKKSGREVWASKLKEEAGHTGGMTPITVQGVPCVAVITQRNLAVIRIDKDNVGKTVATFPWVTDFANSIASPAVSGDSVLITASYNHNAMVRVQFALTSAKEIWRVKAPSKVCTPIIHGKYVYVSWQKFRCLDWETGQLNWEGGVFGDPGSCIATRDERIVVYGGKGKLALIEGAGRSPKEYQELAVYDNKFPSEGWPHVVLTGQRILCRDRLGHLVCLSVKK